MTRFRRGILLVAILVAILVAALAFTIPGGRHRVKLVWLRATGALADVSWSELIRMLPPRSGYNVEAILATRNPYAAITNPFGTPADSMAGRHEFRARCASCHTDTGEGVGPVLTRGQFRHRRSDWALFRSIMHGIPGTAMSAQELSAKSAWQIVAYLRGRSPPDEGAPLVPVVPVAPEVSFERLKGAGLDSANWLTYSGTFDGQRHSRLSQINRASVARLRVKWLLQLETTDAVVETSPLVVGGTMFLTAPPGNVLAVDTRTGAKLWSYSRPLPGDLKLCCGRMNRGLAILGNTLYLGTLDAHLIAMNAQTGLLEWEVEVADYRAGYSITGAPLAVDGRIVMGVAGGDFGVRGFLDAYDAVTGRRLWRFNTIPGPGERNHDTWVGTSWMRGGAPTWMTGSYDVETGLLYWATGNPSPDYIGEDRPGDNLYSNCVVALEAATGKLQWHYQFTPHDEHDWDATEILVLADGVVEGKRRKLILQANRNGFYFVLDRETGTFLAARAFVQQTWADGFDLAGRPIRRAGISPTAEGVLVYPGVGGATNWWSPSYDPAEGVFYVAAAERGGVFYKGEVTPRQDGSTMGSTAEGLGDGSAYNAIRALHATTGEMLWQFQPVGETASHNMGGLLTTAGGVLFGGIGTQFFALDAKQGGALWQINTGGKIRAAPITYLSDGRQQVTVAAGRTILTFSLDGR